MLFSGEFDDVLYLDILIVDEFSEPFKSLSVPLRIAKEREFANGLAMSQQEGSVIGI